MSGQEIDISKPLAHDTCRKGLFNVKPPSHLDCKQDFFVIFDQTRM